MLTLLCQIGEFPYSLWQCENFITLTSLGEHATTFFPVNLRFSEALRPPERMPVFTVITGSKFAYLSCSAFIIYSRDAGVC